MKTDSTNENCCVDQQDYRAPEIMTLQQRLHVDRLNRKGTLEIYYVSDGVFLLKRQNPENADLQNTGGHREAGPASWAPKQCSRPPIGVPEHWGHSDVQRDSERTPE
jgi:hypothetical protein